MQHGTPQRVSDFTARHPGRRLLRSSLTPLFRVVNRVFRTISQYLYATTTLVFSIRNVQNARTLVPVHTSERSRIHAGRRVSRRGRIVS
jgi:hypothetical protein